jgi:hypothetical protein
MKKLKILIIIIIFNLIKLKIINEEYLQVYYFNDKNCTNSEFIEVQLTKTNHCFNSAFMNEYTTCNTTHYTSYTNCDKECKTCRNKSTFSMSEACLINSDRSVRFICSTFPNRNVPKEIFYINHYSSENNCPSQYSYKFGRVYNKCFPDVKSNSSFKTVIVNQKLTEEIHKGLVCNDVDRKYDYLLDQCIKYVPSFAKLSLNIH